jgi:hypothetical protein
MPGPIPKDEDVFFANKEDFEAAPNKATRPSAPSKPKSGSVKPKTPTTDLPNPIRPGGGKLPPPFAKTWVPTVIGTSKPLNAKTAATNAAKKLKTATAVVWNLKNTSSKAPESFEAISSTYGSESVFDHDDRVKVNSKDYAPGGKYRCKFFLLLRVPRI